MNYVALLVDALLVAGPLTSVVVLYVYQKKISEKIEELAVIKSNYLKAVDGANEALSAAQKRLLHAENIITAFLNSSKGTPSIKQRVLNLILDNAALRNEIARLNKSIENKPELPKALETSHPSIKLGSAQVNDRAVLNNEKLVPLTLLEQLQVQLAQEKAAHAITRLRVKDLRGLVEETKQKSSTNHGATEDDSGRLMLRDAVDMETPIIPAESGGLENKIFEDKALPENIEWKINGVITTVPIPQQLAALESFVDRYLKGKVVLTSKSHPNPNEARAYRKTADVYKALLLLGARHDMLYAPSEENTHYFREMCTALRMRCEETGKANTVDLEVSYNGAKLVTTMAIKGSNSRNRTLGMRVYFCDYPSEKKIVVGSLPHHL